MVDLKEHLCTEIKNVIKLPREGTWHRQGEYIYVKYAKTPWRENHKQCKGVALLDTGELIYYWNNQLNNLKYTDMVCVGKGRHHHVEQL